MVLTGLACFLVTYGACLLADVIEGRKTQWAGNVVYALLSFFLGCMLTGRLG